MFAELHSGQFFAIVNALSNFCLANRLWRPLSVRILSLAVLFGVLLAGSSQGEPQGTSGVVEFRTRLRERGGVVRCGLFRKAGWLKTPLATATARADAASALCVFEKIPPGIYAISAFHDKNNNGKLDTNLLSMPIEDYGASNNARATFGPPSFEDAKFAFRGGHARLEAVLR
jgi:uncharacterized protein (DUF2141 family)